MIVEDVDIEIKKFKMYAERADSEAKIVELCKKYLKHKGIDADAPFVNHFKPQEPQKIYIGINDIVSVKAQYKVDGFDMTLSRSNQEMTEMMYARKYVVDQITHQLILDDLILFDTYKHMPTYQTIVQGKLNVWKEPNVKR